MLTSVSPSPLACSTTEDEVQLVCSRLNPNTTQGPDSIPVLLVRNCQKSVISAITSLFNSCWKSGLLPESWKKANSIALFKGKGSRSNPFNYRLVSVTSILSRIMERVVKSRMTSFLEDKGFFSNAQSGFRRGRSTFDNIYILQRAIYQQLQHKKHLPIAFLDISKAFDRVPHTELLIKLYQAGISGRCWVFIQGFLTNRWFRVLTRSCASNWFPTSAGVPQGSVIAPLLFIVYINDLLELEDVRVDFLLFADDIAIIPRIAVTSKYNNVYRQLQAALNHVFDWGKKWKLEYSMEKSNVLLCTNRPVLPLHFFLGDNNMTVVDSYTFLGISLSVNMRGWVEMAASLTRKLLTSTYIITRSVRSFVSPPGPLCALALVQAILLSKLQYSLPFTRFSASQLEKFEHIIARPLKSALGLPWRTSTAAVLCEYGIPCIEIIREKQLLLLYCRSAASSDPSSLSSALSLDVVQFQDSPRPSKTTFSRSIAEEVVTTKSKWQLTDSNKNSLRQLQQRIADEKWNTVVEGSSLRDIKKSVFLAFYIQQDPKPVVCLRARLRMDVANNASSRFKRRLVDSPRCVRCGNSNDTREHLLMVCRVFNASRSIAKRKLSQLRPPIDISSNIIMGVLGDSCKRPGKTAKAHWKRILEITGEFLLSINETMHRL